MAFKIIQNPTFKARVDVDTPNTNGSHYRSHFMAEFQRATNTEMDDLRKLSQVDVMRRKLVGWEEIKDADNVPVEFNAENLEALLNVPEAVYGLSLAFWNSVIKAREKN
jgi:hypothetical protein